MPVHGNEEPDTNTEILPCLTNNHIALAYPRVVFAVDTLVTYERQLSI